MSRKTTRTLAGFATSAFVGFGAFAMAPAALAGPVADTPNDNLDLELPQPIETLDLEGGQEFEYTCSANGEAQDNQPKSFRLDVDGTAQTGEEIAAAASFEIVYFTYNQEEPEPGDLSIQIDFGLGGDAAPAETATLNATYAGENENGESEWEDDTLSVTAYEPGELTFSPGDFSATATTTSGTVTTECSPVATDVIANVNVEGDPVDPPDDGDDDDDDDNDNDNDNGNDDDDNDEDEDEDEGDDDEDEGDDDADEGDDKEAPEDEGGLPVTGAALGGLVAAAVAALGGGGGAMWLSRKRKNATAADEGSES